MPKRKSSNTAVTVIKFRNKKEERYYKTAWERYELNRKLTELSAVRDGLYDSLSFAINNFDGSIRDLKRIATIAKDVRKVHRQMEKTASTYKRICKQISNKTSKK